MEKITLRPFARLLTMLGDQLIKNETIALTELIKNSYDADATWVKVSFDRFGEDYELMPDSKIIIEDNGTGISENIIREHFFNPATPEKKKRKKQYTKFNRIVQGEKGIGRFASLKLGRKITITTRSVDSNKEFTLTLDFSEFEEDFEDKTGKSLFLDELAASIEETRPGYFRKKSDKKFVAGTSGTRIVIEQLKGKWSKNKIDDIEKSMSRLIPPPFAKIRSNVPNNNTLLDTANDDAIEFRFEKDGERTLPNENPSEKLQSLLDDKRVFRIQGQYNESEGKFEFQIDTDFGGKTMSRPCVLPITSPELNKVAVWKNTLGKRPKQSTSCGSFDFVFYIFDFSAQTPPRYALSKDDKGLIKSHRVYLYRDNVRVYPYGDPDDDWLQTDMLRGTDAVRNYFSNDQVVGYISISKESNPDLQDKTNREGLIETGDATRDFIGLIQSFMAYLRVTEYQRYRANYTAKQDTVKAHDIYNQKRVEQSLQNAADAVKEKKPNALKLITEAETEYRKEREYLVRRAETTEQLAAVGLSVETTSHDIAMMMSKSLHLTDALIRETMDNNCDILSTNKDLTTLRGILAFIEGALKDIQLLFRSSKQRRRRIKVKDIIDKVVKIYSRVLKKENIALEILETKTEPLFAKTTDAVLLQVLINLFDNSIYWLSGTQNSNKKIEIRLNEHEQTLVFSDNGPGIHDEDKPYIFEPFYSGKGEEGRGLGLYIARQLLTKDDYSIGLAERKNEMYLSGANFVVRFYSEEE